jgi:hypothetical protein
MSRLLNLDNLGSQSRKIIRDWAGVKHGDDVYLMVARDLNIPVQGKKKKTQIKNAYKILANFYNIDLEDEQRRKQQKRKEEKKQKREKMKKVFVVENPNALSKIRTILKTLKNSSVVVEFIHNRRLIRTHMFNIPNNFSGWWKEKSREFWVDSRTIYADEYDGGKFYIYPQNENITTSFIQQNFREGITNCMLTPIRTWATQMLEASQSKQSKSRYNVAVKHLTEYEEQYKEGVPESAIPEICNKLQIDISVVLPFGENTFIDAKSMKKRIRSFKFMNTRHDHVDINELTSMDKPTIVSQAELNAMKQELDEKKEFYTYNKNLNQISSISTLHGVFSTNNTFSQTVHEFEIKTGLNLCKIDDVDDKKLSAYVKQGTNYNATVDFMFYERGWKEVDDAHPYYSIPDLKHIDMTKAYAGYKSCKHYEGFLGKITDFRCTDKIEGVGLYRITGLVFPNGKLKAYNDKMKIYLDNNVYTSAELHMLSDFGVSYSIVSGCWGVKPLDFDFTDEMLESKVNNAAYYAKWTGVCDSHHMEKTQWIKCDEKFFHVIRANCGADVARYYTNGEASIGYTKKHNYHLGHITAQITAYQRLNVLEQLMAIPIENVVRVCVDGIYFTGTTVLKNVFRYKADRNFENEASKSYVSQACEKSLCYEDGEPREQMPAREHYAKELHLGAGGCGKTHMNLADSGLVRVLFCAPSWKLAVAKKRETGVNATVWARLLTTDPIQITAIKEQANVLVVDECSMMKEEWKKQIFDTYGDMKIIMCGDLGFQLPSIHGDSMTMDGFDNIVKHEKDMRCKDKALREIKQALRDMISEDVPKNEINRWVVEQFRSLGRNITIDELKQIYKVEDMILSGTNANKDFITSLFPTMKKYYITDNTRLHQNGEIVIGEKPEGCKSEIRHCFTTHSIQGETAEHRLFIDSSTMFDSRMFYTAISRARRLDQIYLFDV